MDDFKQHFYQKLVELRLPKEHPHVQISQLWRENYPLPIEGCTQGEIEKLKESQRITLLPKIYEAFLEIAGRDCGDIFRGYDITHYAIHELKDDLLEMIAEDESSRVLPPEAFVFLTQQGHSYWYFSAYEDSYDPPVYVYTEGGNELDLPHMTQYYRDENPEPIFAHLSEFLTLFIAQRESKEAQEVFLRDYVRRK